METNISHRVEEGAMVVGALWSVWKMSFSVWTEMCMFEGIVVSTVLYECDFFGT